MRKKSVSSVINKITNIGHRSLALNVSKIDGVVIIKKNSFKVVSTSGIIYKVKVKAGQVKITTKITDGALTSFEHDVLLALYDGYTDDDGKILVFKKDAVLFGMYGISPYPRTLMDYNTVVRSIVHIESGIFVVDFDNRLTCFKYDE